MSDKRDDYLRGLAASAQCRVIGVHDLDRADVYRAAFNAVCNRDDWKAPVHCLVPPQDELKDLYVKAVMFCTGTTAEFFLTNEPAPQGGYYLRMVAEGYRLGPCGDH